MEDDDNEPRTVLCMRLVDAPPEATVGGSTRGTCAVCGAAVWVSRSTRDLIAAKPAAVFNTVCIMPCGFDIMEAQAEKDPNGELKFEEVPGQREELRKSILQIMKARSN
jgi:hypothetical protein